MPDYKALSTKLWHLAANLEDISYGEEIDLEWLAGQLRRIADELEGEK